MSDVTFVIDDIRYHWLGGFGAIFQSYERPFRRRTHSGDVRMINGDLYYAFKVRPYGWNWEVSWTIEGVDAESIRQLKAKLLGVIL